METDNGTQAAELIKMWTSIPTSTVQGQGMSKPGAQLGLRGSAETERKMLIKRVTEAHKEDAWHAHQPQRHKDQLLRVSFPLEPRVTQDCLLTPTGTSGIMTKDLGGT